MVGPGQRALGACLNLAGKGISNHLVREAASHGPEPLFIVTKILLHRRLGIRKSHT
jgi:hypothetical protein